MLSWNLRRVAPAVVFAACIAGGAQLIVRPPVAEASTRYEVNRGTISWNCAHQILDRGVTIPDWDRCDGQRDDITFPHALHQAESLCAMLTRQRNGSNPVVHVLPLNDWVFSTEVNRRMDHSTSIQTITYQVSYYCDAEFSPIVRYRPVSWR